MNYLVWLIKNYGLREAITEYEKSLRKKVDMDCAPGPNDEVLTLYGQIMQLSERTYYTLFYRHVVFYQQVSCNYTEARNWYIENNVKCKYLTHLGRKNYKNRWAFKKEEDAVWFKTVFGGDI